MAGRTWRKAWPTSAFLTNNASTSAPSSLAEASHSSLVPGRPPLCGQRSNWRGHDQVDVRLRLNTQHVRQTVEGQRGPSVRFRPLARPQVAELKRSSAVIMCSGSQSGRSSRASHLGSTSNCGRFCSVFQPQPQWPGVPASGQLQRSRSSSSGLRPVRQVDKAAACLCRYRCRRGRAGVAVRDRYRSSRRERSFDDLADIVGLARPRHGIPTHLRSGFVDAAEVAVGAWLLRTSGQRSRSGLRSSGASLSIHSQITTDHPAARQLCHITEA